MKKRLPVKAAALLPRKVKQPKKPRKRPTRVIHTYMPWDKHWWSLGPQHRAASIH